jgi:hypothetical protein
MGIEKKEYNRPSQAVEIKRIMERGNNRNSQIWIFAFMIFFIEGTKNLASKK